MLPDALRVYDKARKSQHDLGNAQNRRSYEYASAGKSTEQAVWRQAALAEATRSLGKHVAAALIDLAKAFETINHDLLWDSALRHGFPRRRMTMLIQSYGGRRSVKFDAFMSNAICTNRGVIAGCSFAVSVIKCFTVYVIRQDVRTVAHFRPLGGY